MKEPVTGYSTEELFALWKNFKDDEHSTRILSDFMGAGRAEGAALEREFSARYEARILGLENRGKEAPGREHW